MPAPLAKAPFAGADAEGLALAEVDEAGRVVVPVEVGRVVAGAVVTTEEVRLPAADEAEATIELVTDASDDDVTEATGVVAEPEALEGVAEPVPDGEDETELLPMQLSLLLA